MARTIIATIANFFFPGLGYLINWRRRLLGCFFLLGAIGLTVVETSLKTAAPELYWPMFAAVFVMNTAFAIDAFREGRTLAKERSESRAVPAHAEGVVAH